MDDSDVFLAKAVESLAGAESELINGRYNNCANRCYYGCYQAAVAALKDAGIQPPGNRAEWNHGSLQAQFVGQLINRRKLSPSPMRDVLARGFTLRQTADYEIEHVSEIQATRAMRRAREFVNVVRVHQGES